MNPKEGFKITVEGQYYSTYTDVDGHQQKKIKNYKIQVILLSMDAALSIIRNHLLEPALQKKYADYTRYRTHIIKHVESLSGGVVADIRYMNNAQLIQYIKNNSIKIDITIITDTQELREAIVRYEANPKQYEAWFQRIADDRRTKQMLSALNPEIFAESTEDDLEENTSESSAQDPDSKLDIG